MYYKLFATFHLCFLAHHAIAYVNHVPQTKVVCIRSLLVNPRIEAHTKVSQVKSRYTTTLFDTADSSVPQDSNNGDTNVSAKVGVIKRIRKYFSGPDDGLTTKERLAKMGLAALLSYGWVSNMSYSVTVSLAWYIFSRNTGLSPLAPGQWKSFLAVYAGFWVFNNIVRPLRVGLAIAVSPAFDRIVLSIQERLKVSKGVAITATVLLANLFGTLAAMSLGISLASLCSGVPVFVPKA